MQRSGDYHRQEIERFSCGVAGPSTSDRQEGGSPRIHGRLFGLNKSLITSDLCQLRLEKFAVLISGNFWPIAQIIGQIAPSARSSVAKKRQKSLFFGLPS
jgi:hypothetical protein